MKTHQTIWIQLSILGLCFFECVSCQPKKSIGTENTPPPQNQRFKQTAPEGPRPAGQAASGGVVDGNGGEYIHNERNPWFVGRTPISYCIETSDDFSLSKSQATKDIASAFAAWKDLLTTLDFTGVARTDEIAHTEEPPMRDLALDFKEVKCEQSPPLVFKLGVVDDEAKSALKYSASMTVGFALRTAYDDSSGLAKGFIWLSPDQGQAAYQGPKIEAKFWQQTQLFRNVIIHEIGHVLGFQHIPHSIMDERLPARAVAKGFDANWNGEEFRADLHSGDGYCGIINYADPEVLSTILKVNDKEHVTVCIKWREDLRKVDEPNTPFLIKTMFANSSSQEAVFRQSYAETKDDWLVGIFTELDDQKKSSFKRTWFGRIETHTLYRGTLYRDSTQIPLEVEMAVPGIIILYTPNSGGWGTLGLVPPERKENLFKLYELLDKE